MKRFGCIVLLVILGFTAYGTYRALHPPRVGGVPFAQLPASTQKERRVEAEKLVKKVEEVARSARQGEKKPFTLNISEPQLNTLLQDRLRTEKFPLSDLRAGLSPGLLTLQGTAKVKGFDMPATMDGTLTAENGQLNFKIQSLTVTGLGLPDNVKEKAQKGIEDGLRKAFSEQKNAHVDKVTIETGSLTIEGRTG